MNTDYPSIKSEYITFRNIIDSCSSNSKSRAVAIMGEIAGVMEQMEFDKRMESDGAVVSLDVPYHFGECVRKLFGEVK